MGGVFVRKFFVMSLLVVLMLSIVPAGVFASGAISSTKSNIIISPGSTMTVVLELFDTIGGYPVTDVSASEFTSVKYNYTTSNGFSAEAQLYFASHPSGSPAYVFVGPSFSASTYTVTAVVRGVTITKTFTDSQPSISTTNSQIGVQAGGMGLVVPFILYDTYGSMVDGLSPSEISAKYTYTYNGLTTEVPITQFMTHPSASPAYVFTVQSCKASTITVTAVVGGVTLTKTLTNPNPI